MNSYELTDAGLVTDDPVVAAMFLGYMVKEPRWPDTDISSLDSVSDDCWAWWNEGNFEPEDYPVIIPWPTVWAKIQPIEGEGYTFDDDYHFPDEPLFVYAGFNETLNSADDRRYYHKRVLNIVTTRAELRELVARCKEGM